MNFNPRNLFRIGVCLLVCSITATLPSASHAQGISCFSAYRFGGTNDGGAPTSPLVTGDDGYLYGTTSGGGSHLYGSVFQMDTSGNIYTLHAFAGGTNDGSLPVAGLVQSGAYFYGVTAAGGISNAGTVFKVSGGGAYQVLYSFSGLNDGANPRAGMALGRDGFLYGTTQSGGSNNLGTVFRISTGGSFTNFYSFTGTSSDGAVPEAAMIQANDLNFYGTTYYGGVSNAGVVFKLTTNGTLTTFYSFTGGVDGRNPAAPLIQGTDGNFYGTTYYGGANQSGNMFQLTPGATVNNLYSFAGGTDGARPKAGLLQVSNNFYGTTYAGGASGGGIIFRYNISTGYTNLYSFTGGTEGYRPDAAVTLGSDGNIYGTTSQGDAQDHNGSVFKVIVHPLFFNGEVALSSGVYYLTFPNNTLFGYYNYQQFPIFYHYDLGFSYYFDAHDSVHGAYLYDFTTGHFWYTSPTLFPYIYDFGLNAWLYYYIDTQNAGHYSSNPRYFFNFSTHQVIQE